MALVTKTKGECLLVCGSILFFMVNDMHPVMKVERSFEDGRPLYTLTLSRANFSHLLAGCPDFDRLVGLPTAPENYGFMIFNGDSMPEEFRITGDNFYAYVGAPVPLVPEGVSSEEFDRLAHEVDGTLERAIDESGLIPIHDYAVTLPGAKPVIFGYVRMRVEKAPSAQEATSSPATPCRPL